MYPTDNATVSSTKHTDKTTSFRHLVFTLTTSACYIAVPFAIITLIFHDVQTISTNIHNYLKQRKGNFLLRQSFEISAACYDERSDIPIRHTVNLSIHSIE